MSAPNHITPLPGMIRETLSDESLREILSKGIIRKFEAGDLIPSLGQDGDCFRFLVRGEVRVFIVDHQNQEITVDILRRWDMFEESQRPGDDGGEPASPMLKARETSEILEIPTEALETILREKPSLGVGLVRSLCRQMTNLRRRVFETRLKKRALRSVISRKEHIFPDYITGEHVRQQLTTRVKELARSDGPVLVIGESGVGKEFIAHSIFSMSSSYREVFLLLDLFRQPTEIFPDGEGPACSLETDPTEAQMRLLFGFEEISPGGGFKETPGFVDLSEDGTLMVRGVERLSPEVQQKLLNCSLTGTFQRWGGSLPQRARFRLIATTRLDLSISPDEHPLVEGLLRRSVMVPPLRSRRREIPLLIDHYMQRYCRELRKGAIKLPRETFSMLVNYSWPGNDMELATTLKRAILVSDGETLRPKDIYFDLKRVEDRGKFNLMRFRPVRQAFLSPLFPAILQSAVTPFFLILVALLFLGPSEPLRNPAAVFCWAVGWPILIIGAFLWARFWCTLCPIGTLSRLARKLVAFDLPFPAILRKRSDFVIAGSVLGVIWFETATDIRNSPVNLGLLLVTMVCSAAIVAILFERQSWCRYLCGLGGMISVAAKASILELRADRSVCLSSCRSNECYVGTDAREGCPFGQSVPRLDSNRLCKLCGICIKNCPHDGINLNLRIPGKEIWEMRRANTGTAFLVISMIGGLLSEMFAKTPLYGSMTLNMPVPEIARFTGVFLTTLVAANLMIIVAAWLSHRVYGDSWEQNYYGHGVALIPLALTSFMAYHVYYLINLGTQLPLLLSQNINSEVLRWLIVKVQPSTTHLIQQFLIWAGLAWSLVIVYRLGRGSHDRLLPAMIGAIPHALVTVALALVVLQGIKSSFYG